MTMDEAKLSEIEARARAATPGPWLVCAAEDAAEGLPVAHAREDVPALVAEVRRLQKANEALVAAFDAALARSHDRITVSGHRAIVPQIGNVLLTRIESAAW